MKPNLMPVGGNVVIPNRVVEFQLSLSGSCDVLVFLTYDDGRNSDVLTNKGVSTFNHPSVQLNGNELRVNTDNLPSNTSKLAFCMAVEHGDIGFLNHVNVDILSNGIIATSKLDTLDRKEKAITLFEVYNHKGAWKTRFLAQGFNDGKDSLAKNYGFRDSLLACEKKSNFENASSNSNKITRRVVNSSGNDEFINNSKSNSNVNQSGNSVMSFFSKAKNLFSESSEAVSNELMKFKNKVMLKAILSASVYVAAADDDISAEEKKKTMAFLERSEELRVFDKTEVITIFNELANNFDFDADIARGECMKNIVKIKGNESQCRLLIQVVIAIAKSDGDFDENEEKAVSEIATALGVNL